MKQINRYLSVVCVIFLFLTAVIFINTKIDAISGQMSDISATIEVFTTANKDDVLSMLQHGTGVVMFGWEKCPWCTCYAEKVKKIADMKSLDVLYYDIYSDRENQTEFYKEVISILANELSIAGAFDSTGKPRLYVPDLTCVINGQIIYHNNFSSMETGDYVETCDEYWQTHDAEFTNQLSNAFTSVKKAQIELDNRGCGETCEVKR